MPDTPAARRGFRRFVRQFGWLMALSFLLLILPFIYNSIAAVPDPSEWLRTSGTLEWEVRGDSATAHIGGMVFTCSDMVVGESFCLPEKELDKWEGKEAHVTWFKLPVYPFVTFNYIIELTVENTTVISAERTRALIGSGGVFMLIVGLVLSAVWIGMSWLARNAEEDTLKEARDNANAQYRQLKVPSGDPRFAFDSETAEVVKTEETYQRTDGGFITGYIRTRYARNPHGEYFMIMSGDSPFFKHVPHTVAKVVLGKQYRAPA